MISSAFETFDPFTCEVPRFPCSALIIGWTTLLFLLRGCFYIINSLCSFWRCTLVGWFPTINDFLIYFRVGPFLHNEELITFDQFGNPIPIPIWVPSAPTPPPFPWEWVVGIGGGGILIGILLGMGIAEYLKRIREQADSDSNAEDSDSDSNAEDSDSDSNAEDSDSDSNP